MHARQLSISGAFEFTPVTFPDQRGLFVSTFLESAFRSAVGHRLFPVAQASYSVSRRGVLRGVHYTATPPGVAKYVCCVKGRALDILVDVRVGSPTFGQSEAVLLSGDSFHTVYFPVGVGHAFVALEDDTVMSYLLSGEYVARNELAVAPLDPGLALPVPADIDPVCSERDMIAPTLAQARQDGLLPGYATCLAIEATLAPGVPATDSSA